MTLSVRRVQALRGALELVGDDDGVEVPVVVIQDTLEQTGASPEIVTDYGSLSTAKDFMELVREFELKHIRIRAYHSESNGKLE